MSKETFHQTLALLTVFFNEFGTAIGYGWIAPVLPTLQKSDGEFHLTQDQCSWIASLSHIGKLLGSISSAFVLDRIGRRLLLSLCAAIHLISWLLILFTRSVNILYLVRLAIGLGTGINDGANSVYLGEISSPFNRSIFGFVKNLFYNTGFLFEFLIATYFPYHTTAIVNTILESVLFLAVFLLVESPQYLFMKDKFEQAEKIFIWLKGANGADTFKDEFEKIKHNIRQEVSRKSSYQELFGAPANYKSILINSVYAILSGFLGYYAVMSYAPLVFTATKMLSPSEFLIIVATFKVFWVICLICIVNRFNRRSLVLSSSIIIFFSHAFTAILYYVEDNVIKIPYFPWFVFVSIALFTAAYSVIYTTTFLIRGELFPLSIKPLGNCITIACYAISSFLTTKIFLHISHHYGIHVNFLIFSLVSLSTSIFTYLFLPETRNKSLIDIQEIIGKKTWRMM